MPTFNYESQSARLELRIMELEDTMVAVIGVIKTMNEMLGTLNEITNHYADTLGGLLLRLPSTVHKIPFWPVQATSIADKITPCNPLCRCAESPNPPNEPPKTP